MPTSLSKRWAGAGLLSLLALVLFVTPALGAGKEEKVSILYTLSAGKGTLKPKQGKGALYELTLKKPDRDLVWFSDRPARRSGAYSSRVLVEAWRGFGFAADPPNAALVYSDRSGEVGRTVIVELSHPRLTKGKISFAARVLDPNRIKAPNLVGHAKAADRTPASEIIDPTLFIDDAEAPVSGVCILQPLAVCENNPRIYVRPSQQYNFWGANFNGSRFIRAIFHDSSFTDTKLQRVQLENSFLEGDEFERADLTGADLTGSRIEGVTQFRESILNDVDFSKTIMLSTPFFESTMENVNFEYAVLAGVRIESTQMREANFGGAELEGLRLNSDEMYRSNFSNSRLEGIKLRSANIGSSDVTNAHLTDVDLTNADVQSVDFSGSVLNGVNFSEARIQGSIFVGASLCNVTMPEGTVVNSGC